MKKFVAVFGLALLTFTVAGCSSDYVIEEKNGEMIITTENRRSMTILG